MRVNGRTVKIIIGCVLAVGSVACVIKLASILYEPKATLTATMATSAAVTTDGAYTPPNEDEAVIPTYTDFSTDATSEEYVCPVDFAALQAVNPDIYAWVRIEGTDIDFPVLQSPTDDSYYLTHNSDGEYSSAGSVFSEYEYNSTDFTDPVTILYGHRMKSGAIFGNLQLEVTEDTFWDSEPVIEIYLPDKLLKYQIFAAVPYDRAHILYYHDFADEETYNSFFNNIMSINNIEARFHEEYAPVYGDKVLMLSTCLIGDSYYRFIVMGTLVYDSSSPDGVT